MTFGAITTAVAKVLRLWLTGRLAQMDSKGRKRPRGDFLPATTLRILRPVLADNDRGITVHKRLLDYFSYTTPWQRQLWRLGTILEMRELLEASREQRRSVLSEEAVKWLGRSLVSKVKRDVGLGAPNERGRLAGHVARDLPPNSHDAHALALLVERATGPYLSNWATALRAEPQLHTEVVARAVGSHLLDGGFSSTFLHKWFTYHTKYSTQNMTIADMLDETATLYLRPVSRYEVLVPLLGGAPTAPDRGAHWLDRGQTAEWLRTRFPKLQPGVRQAGGLTWQVDARDAISVTKTVADEIQRISTRFRVGARQNLQFADVVYIAGENGPTEYAQPPRRVEVHALQSTSAIYELRISPELSSVLELLDPLDQGTTAAAVAGSWAAIEALFNGPGDREKVSAATRMARIVSCSYVRHEFTALANAYATEHSDSLAMSIRASAENIDRARAFEDAVRSGAALTFQRTRHAMALARARRLVQNPAEILPNIVGQLGAAFRRLYRQRNIIVHGGDVTSIALPGTLRTVAPLVGAGVDRVVHASATRNASPLELAVLAEVRQGSVSDGRCRLVDMLDSPN